MAFISLQDVEVAFPLFDAPQRSLKRRLLTALPRRDEAALTARALNGVSLEVAPGTRLAVLGGNSSGKTTLLRVMAGLIQPRRGGVTIGGRVGAVFGMGFGIHPNASLADLALGQALLAGLPLRAAKVKAQEILDFAEVGGGGATSAQVAPPGLTGRVGVAACLCLDSEIMLLDEVLELVDPSFIEKVQASLDQPARAGTILVMTERSRSILNTFCTDAVVLDGGRVTLCAPLADVLATGGHRLTF